MGRVNALTTEGDSVAVAEQAGIDISFSNDFRNRKQNICQGMEMVAIA